jgi:uncharacterized membrane protein
MSQIVSDDSARPVRAGHTAERIGYFTDAVFAIAMTLLVIEIPRPDSSDFRVGGATSKSDAFSGLWHFFTSQGAAFFAYVLAFYILWIVWRQHHTLLDQVGQVSTAMIAVHFPLLLLAAFLPYASTVMGHYANNPLADLLFGVVVGALFGCRALAQTRADRDGVLLTHVDRDAYRIETMVAWLVTGYWVLTLALVWWAPWVQIAWALTGLVASRASRILTRRASRARRHP